MAYYKGASFGNISPFLLGKNTCFLQVGIPLFVSVKVTDSPGLPAVSLESANQSPPIDWQVNKIRQISRTNPNVNISHNLNRLQPVEKL